jgi:hypothetical protein
MHQNGVALLDHSDYEDEYLANTDENDDDFDDDDDAWDSVRERNANLNNLYLETKQIEDLARDEINGLRAWRVSVVLVILVTYICSATGTFIFLYREQLDDSDERVRKQMWIGMLVRVDHGAELWTCVGGLDW